MSPEPKFGLEGIVRDALIAATEAVKTAALADFRVSKHEELCTLRHDQVLSSMKGLWKIVLGSAATLIVGMASLIVVILVRTKI